MGRRAVQKGFTLVELSLSIMIIGLLVAAVFSGLELKRSAELRSVVADIHKFNTSIRTFEGKFGYLPGDIYNASRYFPGCVDQLDSPCNGNGDGQISPVATEGLRAWQHLALSGLYPGGFSGLMDTSDELAFEGGNSWEGLLMPTAFASNGQQKWDVCHNSHTINVANPAVLNAHLMHGDTIGECDDADEDDEVAENDDDDECDDDDDCDDNDGDDDDDKNEGDDHGHRHSGCDVEGHGNSGPGSHDDCDDEDDEGDDANNGDDGDCDDDDDEGCNGGSSSSGGSGSSSGSSSSGSGSSSGASGSSSGSGGGSIRQEGVGVSGTDVAGLINECDLLDEGYIGGKFTAGVNVPGSKLANGAYGIDYQGGGTCGNRGNHIVLASIANNWLNGSVISPEDAWNIDFKMDDGIANNGLVEAYNGQGGTCVNGGLDYIKSNDDSHCQLQFEFE